MGGNNLRGGPTRLDGLVSLLDSGTNPAVRKMAATQIGDLVAAHPSETRPVLRRVRKLLRSTMWETRIAAGQAIAAIAEHSPRFVPQSLAVKVEASPPAHPHSVTKEEIHLVSPASAKPEPVPEQLNPTSRILLRGLQFHTFRLDEIMQGASMLFGSSGDEYKRVEMGVAEQRARLKADLGLDDRFTSSGADILGLKDDDLVATRSKSSADQSDMSPNGVNDAHSAAAAADVVAEMSGEAVSARERNRLKRLAKRKARMGGDVSRPPKRPRGKALSNPSSSSGGPEVFSLSDLAAPNDDDDEDYEKEFGADYWDFQPTCEILKESLLETRWEWRHGAAIGLRQMLMRHAHSAGRHSPGPLGDEENARWLEDICCRLLCVLAMDRFGDFVGDAVVAPVREGAAMTIGASARALSPDTTRRLVDKIFYLLETDKSSQWEVRHAALLGARYVLAVKEDMSEELLNLSFQSITNGLRDQDDDVRAVAAEALLPVAANVVRLMPLSVPLLVSTLWEALLDLDDISASTSSIMRLLSEVTSHPAHPDCNCLWLEPDMLKDLSDDESFEKEKDLSMKTLSGVKASISDVLIELVPRLWPFLRHSSKGVRRAAVNLLHTLTESFNNENLLQWARPLCSEIFSRLFRNILLETEEDILETSHRVWARFLEAFGSSHIASKAIVQSVGPMLPHWIHVAAQETRAEAASYEDSRNRQKVTPAARRRSAAAARRAAKLRKAKGAISVIPQTLHDRDNTPAEEGPFDGALMQQSVAIALGLLATFWPSDDGSMEVCFANALQSPFAIARRVACDISGNWAKMSRMETFVFPARICAALEREVASDGGCPYAEVGISVGSFFSESFSFLDTLPSDLTGIIMDLSSLKTACEHGKMAVLSKDSPAAAICARSIKSQMSDLVTGDTWEYIHKSLRAGGMHKRQLESLEALRMRMLSSIGYMTVREDACKISLAASASFALVTANGYTLPKKVGSLIKALMAGVKGCKNLHIQNHASKAISQLALRLSTRESKKALSLMLKNLMKYLTGDQTLSDQEINASMTASTSVTLDSPALAKRGSLFTFRALCASFGANLFTMLPSVWSRISDPLCTADVSVPNTEINPSMTVLRSIVAHVVPELYASIVSLLPYIINICAAPHMTYAEHAPLCLADVVAAIPAQGMQNVVTKLVPLLSGNRRDKNSDRCSRRGAAKALRAVVGRLGARLIPYAAFMIVPMMTRMVDEDEDVRDASAGVFGTLIRLMPLEGGAPDDPQMSEAMALERREARTFLGQLLGTEPRAHYKLPVSIGDGITLRKYQQECLDWLGFLNKYGLHGALCDDMGLGKTLMTLCIITGDYVSSVQAGRPFPSLVLCPSTIVAHWIQEAERFFGHVLKGIVHYAGLPKTRARIRERIDISQASLVITSYDILSNDLRYFEGLRWNYVVLDEGHVIKNSKTKVARAVRALSANHRLILTGTPIQNSVIELWAMFDFLMPGFLGNEKSFKETYAKPIMSSREGKCTEADQEKGMVATEALHRQVLPFVLRRLKDDVLSELPPKIMQDYYCHMTPLQLRLYEDFASDVTNGSGLVPGEEERPSGKGSRKGGHVFQALSYLRRLCSHPKLVLSPKHPEYESVHAGLQRQGKSINDIDSSSKLVGLMNILHECGIGLSQNNAKDSGGHRVLIFAQLKQMLDLVEKDLFGAHMPDVTYLRLDGSVEASKRQPIVTRFNADPTIDCLLLTTHVGGLGLNLTGADTVIFLEHDWNPTKDLQAMDRAHRMGQKRTVNVYRLITRGTLEEKIMGIQRFKTHIANTVVNRENSNLQSMNTEQLLDLFKVENAEVATSSDGMNDLTMGAGKGMKAALAGIGELWEEKQYEDEHNMNEFLAGMGRQ